MKKSRPETAAHLFQFPLVIIDFEATALSFQSYPIEVGVARTHTPAGSISTWSTLISPDASWDVTAQWDLRAQQVHGISRAELRRGLKPTEVMADLNAWIGDVACVWCDGGQYDLHWLMTLADAAHADPTFELHDLRIALSYDTSLRDSYQAILNQSAPPHRAAPDAERICRALAKLLWVEQTP
jgi:hypothetical protein